MRDMFYLVVLLAVAGALWAGVALAFVISEQRARQKFTREWMEEIDREIARIKALPRD